jgi:hypothetical protein
MPFLNERACHQLDQMNRNNGDMAATKDGDPSLTFVLQQCKFLRQGVNPIESWQIQ